MFLGHIRDAADKIIAFTKDYTYEQFLLDDKTYSAVIRELSVIGEAAGRVDQTFQAEHTNIPWADIIGMRHNLIHDYVGTSPAIVWKTCTKDIPVLKKSLEGVV